MARSSAFDASFCPDNIVSIYSVLWIMMVCEGQGFGVVSRLRLYC
jgi:hypothetical protein